MKQRSFYIAGAAVLILIGIFMPTGWYDTIPRKPGMVLPFNGASLLRLTFLVEAVVLLLLAAKNVRFVSLPAEHGELVPGRKELDSDISRGEALAWLGAITCLAIYLRVQGLEQDLWLDEITPLKDYMQLSPAQVIGSYLRSNNHLLNTLLERITIGVFGESEWSARLPAAVFGMLTVPTLYWVARTALSRIASLGAALVLAVSYHHVFFSQNARGYSAYLFFAVLATGLLVRALQKDRLWMWALYVTAIVLGSASLLITAFVIAAHVIICAIVGVRLWRRGLRVAPFTRRIVGVLGIAGFLAFQIYATALPEAYVVLTTIYAEPGTGYPPFSMEFFREMARGITAGLGNPVLAAILVVLGAIGFAALLILSWPLGLALVLPIVLMATVLAIRGLTFSPRFFLLLMPLAILAGMSAMQVIAVKAREKGRISADLAGFGIAAGALLLAFAAGMSLPYYYRTPKQPYRDAIALVEARGGTDNIVVLSNAETGFDYYTRRFPVRDRNRYRYTRTAAGFDSLTGPDQSDALVLTTFSRALIIELPEVAAKLSRDWRADATLGATIGDGEITVWSRKPPVRSP